MKNTFGNMLSVTIFGESHGAAVGAVLDGLPSGIEVDEEYIKERLSLRRPSGAVSTGRAEPDEFIIESGVYRGKTTGTPLCIVISNTCQRSGDYESLQNKPRPSHADFAAHIRYGGFEDPRGGGHFSGRITAALVAAGAIVLPELKRQGVEIGCHIKRCAGIEDRGFEDFGEDFKKLSTAAFGVLDDNKKAQMIERIKQAKAETDSVGGILETAVIGMPKGVGEPWFDSVESVLAHALFSIPAVKGVEFGSGFGFADMKGSEANDAFMFENGEVKTKTNHNGGINGGITNGMEILFSCAVKPTPSIGKEQATVDLKSMQNTTIKVGGRHDPCIVHRARPVVESVAALALYDCLLTGGKAGCR